MGSSFFHFALGRSHLPENSIVNINRPFAAWFSNCSDSFNFEAKINFNTSRQNELKWRKICTGLKFDLEHFNGPKSKFFRDSLYEHPVVPGLYFLIVHFVSSISLHSSNNVFWTLWWGLLILQVLKVSIV